MRSGPRLLLRGGGCGDVPSLVPRRNERRLHRPDYAGPATWDELEVKFLALGGRPEQVAVVKELETLPVSALAERL